MNKNMRNFYSLKQSLGLLILFLMVSVQGAWAQWTVKGTVNDDAGEPIIGASVKVAGTNTGAVTDLNGNFSVNATKSGQLVVSYVGYETQRVKIDGRQTINIVLKDDAQTLSDVVVIGYGTAKRSDISGSVASIDANQMMKKTPINLADGLKGSAPGVIVTQQDGAPDALAQVRIRGIGTINGDGNPLYVVDGVQVGTNANFLNPQDIESIEILKDASATAIYGSRGANGVVMITTKHGSKGAARVDVSANWSVQTLSRKFETLGVDEYAASIRAGKAAKNQTPVMGIWDAKYDGKRKYIDWQDEMTRTALRQNYSMSASGGTDKMQGSFSVGYMNNDGIVINTNYERMNVRGTFKGQVNNYLEVGGDINFTHSKAIGSNVGIGNNGNLSSVRDYATMTPTMDYTDANGNIISPNVENPDGTYGTFYQTATQGSEAASQDSYYAKQMELDNPNKSNRVLVNAYVDLTLVKGLHWKTIGSYDYSGNDSYNWQTEIKRFNPDAQGNFSKDPTPLNNVDTRRKLNLSQNTGTTTGLESYLTYNWSNDLHDVTAMLGYSVSKNTGQWVSAGATDFVDESIRVLGMSDDLDTKDGNGAFNLETRFVSYFGRVMYSFGNRYNLTATVRRDGSSNFGSGNRWGTFPSVAASWRISEEAFMKDIDFVSNLKLRLGWGRTGNAGGATSNAIYQLGSTEYRFYPAGATTQGFNRGNGLAQLIIANPDLKWETNEQTNVGLDFSILGGDLSVSLDYFQRDSKDLLLYQSVRPSSGYQTYYNNLGLIRNRGFEFSLNYNKRLNNDWTIGATVTGSTLSNKVVECGLDVFNECSGGNDGSNIDGSNVQAINASGYKWSNHSICREGYAVGSYYGYRTAGIFRSQEEIDAYGVVDDSGVKYQPGDVKFVDLDGDGKITADDMDVIGDGVPDFNFGITLNATYKNWDMSVHTYGVLGQDILSYSAMRLSTMLADADQVPCILKDSYDRSFTNNPNGDLPRLVIQDDVYNTRCSDLWIKNGNFFKIGNVQVGYTFDKKLLAPLKLQSARVSLSVTNLLCISPYNKYGDPECGQGSVVFTGLDTGRYPTPRTYSLGLSVQF